MQISFLLGKGCDIVRRCAFNILHDKEPHRILDFHPNKPKNSSRQKKHQNHHQTVATPPLCVCNPPVTKIIPACLRQVQWQSCKNWVDKFPAIWVARPPRPKKVKKRAQVVLMMGLRFRLLENPRKKPREICTFPPACFFPHPKKGKGFLYIIC